MTLLYNIHDLYIMTLFLSCEKMTPHYLKAMIEYRTLSHGVAHPMPAKSQGRKEGLHPLGTLFQKEPWEKAGAEQDVFVGKDKQKPDSLTSFVQTSKRKYNFSECGKTHKNCDILPQI